ncbi:hypothetical protein SLA2020_374050 [Shorea laevis]
MKSTYQNLQWPRRQYHGPHPQTPSSPPSTIVSLSPTSTLKSTTRFTITVVVSDDAVLLSHSQSSHNATANPPISPSCLSFLSNMPRVPSGRFDSLAKPGQPSNCASTVKFRKHTQGNLAIPYTEFLVILVEETVARTL